MDQMFREFIVTHERAILDVESRKDLTIFCYNLGGKLTLRILKILERRDVGKGPDWQNQYENHRHRDCEQYPEPLDYPFFSLICHFSIRFCVYFIKI